MMSKLIGENKRFVFSNYLSIFIRLLLLLLLLLLFCKIPAVLFEYFDTAFFVGVKSLDPTLVLYFATFMYKHLLWA